MTTTPLHLFVSLPLVTCSNGRISHSTEAHEVMASRARWTHKIIVISVNVSYAHSGIHKYCWWLFRFPSSEHIDWHEWVSVPAVCWTTDPTQSEMRTLTGYWMHSLFYVQRTHYTPFSSNNNKWRGKQITSISLVNACAVQLVRFGSGSDDDRRGAGSADGNVLFIYIQFQSNAILPNRWEWDTYFASREIGPWLMNA